MLVLPLFSTKVENICVRHVARMCGRNAEEATGIRVIYRSLGNSFEGEVGETRDLKMFPPLEYVTGWLQAFADWTSPSKRPL